MSTPDKSSQAGPTPRVAREAGAAVLLLAAPAAIVLARLGLGDEVPDPVATHWSGAGTADGSTALATYTVTVAVLAALAALAGLAVLVGRRGRVGRAESVAVAAWAGALLATTYAGTLVASRGASSAAEVPMPWWLVVAVLAVPLAVGSSAYLLVPRSRPDASAVLAADTIELAEGERAVWVGSASSRPVLVGGLVVATLGLAVALVRPGIGLGVLAVGLLLVAVQRVTVRVDEGGVTIAWGLGRWPRWRHRLASLEAAEAREMLEPLAWGGWGYRVTPTGRACIVRRGPGLVLHRHGAVPVAVTVDDPEQAAGLVNAYLRRRAAAGRTGG